MADGDKAFVGSIPEIYDSYLVPLIFEPYADDLAKRVAGLSPTSVLETATGSGAVTRAMSKHLSQAVQYTATDLNQPMIDHAAQQQGSGLQVSWQQADALKLPFADAAFDVVVCQFGVMLAVHTSEQLAACAINRG